MADDRKIGHSLRFACRASKKRKPKRCTKRVQSSSSVGSQQSTSNSSTDTDCSSDNNTSDSIVELFRQPVLAPNPMVMQEPVVTSEVSSDRYSRLMENAQGIYKSPHADHFSIDDLMVMLQTDDIVSAVKNLDFEDNNHGNFQNGVPARRGSGNLMSLLLDPVGEF